MIINSQKAEEQAVMNLAYAICAAAGIPLFLR